MAELVIEDLWASVGGTDILRGIDLRVRSGEVHAVMGPNGSGKSTLCHVLMGKPGYEADGSAAVAGVELLDKDVDVRARAGLMAAFQYPTELPGISLRAMLEELGEGEEYWGRVEAAARSLGVGRFLDRPVNEDLSGGEKKRSEIFQLAVLGPKAIVLDEIDSGLDIDAVRDVAAAVEGMRSPDVGILLITHYNRILQYLEPDRVHILIDGRIVRSGGPEVADELEDRGYAELRAEAAGT